MMNFFECRFTNEFKQFSSLRFKDPSTPVSLKFVFTAETGTERLEYFVDQSVAADAFRVVQSLNYEWSGGTRIYNFAS